MRPLVVKFGGSLLGCAPSLVRILAAAPRPILVVPGGGPFADVVRTLDPAPDAAHWMAIAAMEQVGLYLAALGLPGVEALRIPDAPSVLLPYRLLRDRDPLPHSWRVSSDTIAAWCAAELECDLLLAKSVDGIVVDGRLLETVTVPLETDTVDPCLVPFALAHGVSVRIVNARVSGRLGRALRNDPVPGTRIDPSLFVGRA
ncbi:MAG TPA: uridylate kinase [Methanoregulaceae archaeon]|nr:uridylate kinase [Methanoregulaceae archaeon]